jgi:hypothetical protein
MSIRFLRQLNPDRILRNQDLIMRALLLVSLLTLITACIHAQGSIPVPAAVQTQSGLHAEWTSEVLVSNNSVWRGFLSNRTATLQPSVTLGVGAFSLTSTTVLEFDGHYCWKEHDLQLSFTRPLTKRISLTSGYINYAYPAADKDRFANEFFAGIALEGRTGLRLQTFQDVGLSSGTYMSGEVSRSWRSAARFPIRVAASVGFNRKLFIPASTFSDAVFTVSTEIPVRSGVRISPQMGYSKGLNRQYFRDYFSAGLRIDYTSKAGGSSDL